MRGVVHLQPLRRRDLVRTDDATHLVIENLGRRPRQRPETGLGQFHEVLVERQAERRSPLPHLERRERMHVQAGHRFLDRTDDREVVVACERRMDPALQTDLGRAALPGLLAAAHDLLVRHEVRRAAEVRRQLSLREGTEPAAEVTDVRVLDVARDDVGHLVAADLAPELIGGRKDTVALVPPRAEQANDVLLAELCTSVDRQRVPRDERDPSVLARRPAVLARKPERIGCAQNRRQHVRVDPLGRRSTRDRPGAAGRARGRGSRCRRGAVRARAREPPG